MLANIQGIVLRQTKYKDSDKILTIFTRENGKIQAIAKGARKPRSSLIASTQVFCYSNFIMYKGKSMYNINQGEVINSFYSLREDLQKLGYATYLMELTDFALAEEEPNERLFGLLIKTLKLLSKLPKNYEKLIRAFEIKYISFIGYRPYIDRCVFCNDAPVGKLKFSITDGGVICEKCSHKVKFAENIDSSTLNAMRLLLYSELDKLDDLEIDKKTMQRIQEILIKYILEHIDKRNFRSLDFLRAIE
ncbi:DNA repair protein RecO [Caldisalinibacter kiritimatiensis]|uniref:DNA repair protein RecO n=1 Tax=Caldisalinibacter kiritimatiensis TaxID=1304284 RepID=R1CT97_9FIRM|nr:DNA repair protein RecO [Caldisalinibacter kiritimatiensis]EOD01871.1 DNA recombination and repair protein RecO [Caldisalinibacter kiritimatiensis]